MQPRRPQLRPLKKNLSRFRLTIIPQVKQKSLFAEYYYVFLGLFTCVLVLLLTAGGMGFSDALVIGLWIGGIAFFITQIVRYARYKNGTLDKSNPAGPWAKLRGKVESRKSQRQAAPAKPLASVTDAPSIKLVPKPGQAPRPPIITGSAKPSPFIKPPK